MIDPTIVLARHAQASASRVGDETVILHLGSGTYFGLDPVGTRIWELLEHPLAMAALHKQLLSEFAVEAEELTQDIKAFLGQMLEHGILVADGG